MMSAEIKPYFQERFHQEKALGRDPQTAAVRSLTWVQAYCATLARTHPSPPPYGLFQTSQEVAGLLGRCSQADSYTEAVRKFGSIFNDPTAAGLCFVRTVARAVSAPQPHTATSALSFFDMREAEAAFDLIFVGGRDEPRLQGVRNSIGHATYALVAELIRTVSVPSLSSVYYQACLIALMLLDRLTEARRYEASLQGEAQQEHSKKEASLDANRAMNIFHAMMTRLTYDSGIHGSWFRVEELLDVWESHGVLSVVERIQGIITLQATAHSSEFSIANVEPATYFLGLIRARLAYTDPLAVVNSTRFVNTGLSQEIAADEEVMHADYFVWRNAEVALQGSRTADFVPRAKPAVLTDRNLHRDIEGAPEVIRSDALARDTKRVQQLQERMNALVSFHPKSFCQIPWILDTATKSNILHVDALMRQRSEYAAVSLSSNDEAPYFVLKVRREYLLQDTLDVMNRSQEVNKRKPLKVVFVGEEGVDAGGVRKEFFLLMFRRLLDPGFGMFGSHPELRTLWFNPDSMESERQFELVGTLMGLAVYNQVILDLELPKVVWRKLLAEVTESSTLDGSSAKASGSSDGDGGELWTLRDLDDIDPDLGRGLTQLLHFDGDVESTFCRTMTASRDSMWGTVVTEELFPGGSTVPVTNENRLDYVRRLLAWKLDTSISAQFKAFRRGFYDILGESMLRALDFSPEELELLVVGSSQLDFKALQASTRYEGFTQDSMPVVWLWRTVHAFSEEDKKRFLRFVTGSDRVPVRGLVDLKLVITRHGSDSNRIPSSHTCFNHFLLPAYSSEEKLRTKLAVALQNAEGFGTI